MWENTNKLIDKTGYDGIKTGITDNAGACLATSYRKNINSMPTHLIIIVLNCRNMEARF
jgi:serine-type D-Ala-D-Ala carboxypeptidase (penicillin-binding protein 5/6)